MTTPHTPPAALDVAAIEARAAAATAEPWRVEHGRTYDISTGAVASVECFVRRPDDDVAIAAEIVDPATGLHSDANAEFIAHAREDVPALLAHITALRAQHAADVAAAVRAETARCIDACKHVASQCPTEDDRDLALTCAEAIEVDAPTGGGE